MYQPPQPPEYQQPAANYPSMPPHMTPIPPSGTYPPPPQMRPPLPYGGPPVPVKKKPVGWIIALIIVAIISYGAGQTNGRQQAEMQAPVQTSQQEGAAPTGAPPVAPSKPKEALKWVTTHTLEGVGSKTPDGFTITGQEWKLVWECSGLPTDYPGTAPFFIEVYKDGKLTFGSGVDSSCQGGATGGKGESIEHKQGSIYLHINTVTDLHWKIQIQEMK